MIDDIIKMVHSKLPIGLSQKELLSILGNPEDLIHLGKNIEALVYNDFQFLFFEKKLTKIVITFVGKDYIVIPFVFSLKDINDSMSTLISENEVEINDDYTFDDQICYNFETTYIFQDSESKVVEKINIT